MTEQTFIIGNKSGIHARPATLLTTAATKFKSEISLVYGERTVNMKSIMGLMSLGAEGGKEVLVKADGPDEVEAIATIAGVFNSNFGE